MRTKPCKYFQLNARYFNAKKGIFSKFDMDTLIPDKWRLPQQILDDDAFCLDFPVFVKPEWGQNSTGVKRIDNAIELQEIKGKLTETNIQYVVQQASMKKIEYEIFAVGNPNKKNYQVLTVAQVVNNETLPVNSIYNTSTQYIDITQQFTEQQMRSLWDIIRQLGEFGIVRLGAKAESLRELISGQLDIIEMNLFVPMPINILDKKYSFFVRCRMVSSYIWALAKATKYRDTSQADKPVFIKQMLYNRDNTLLNYIQERI